jgi:hypothetical protein
VNRAASCHERRVLHVLRRMDPGGIALWLLDLLRSGGIRGWAFEIAVQQPGAFDEELRGLGVPVHRWSPRHPGPFLQLLGAGYHTVPNHVHTFSGIVLAMARAADVQSRIAHSHCCESAEARPQYYWLMRRLLKQHATRRLAVRLVAAPYLFQHADEFSDHPHFVPFV